MKKLIILFVMLCLTGASFAQSGVEKRSVFHFSFVPPLSTNGRYAAQYTNTASVSMLVGLSENEKAFSLAGMANIILKEARGFQMAGLLNYAGEGGRGFMMSGMLNITPDQYRGFQLAGLLNSAKDFKGFQFSGLGNIAGDVRGFQFGGLFNVAKRVSGVQLAGVVNIAESSDYPIALLNIIRNGEYSVAATYNDMGTLMISFRSGGRVTYGILGVGYNHKTDNNGLTTEAGLGAHINISKWFRINNEVKGGTIGSVSDDNTFYANYSLLPAFRFAGNFEVFAGPSINYMQTDDLSNKSVFPNHSLWKKHTDKKLQQFYIGWQTGVQFIF